MRDHIHICISIPPKYSVSHVAEYIKGKGTIAIAWKFRGKQRNFNGEHFWEWECFVSIGGLDEDMVREYIRHQEENNGRRDQMKLGV